VPIAINVPTVEFVVGILRPLLIIAAAFDNTLNYILYQTDSTISYCFFSHFALFVLYNT
jgi:hypothetical protein